MLLIDDDAVTNFVNRKLLEKIDAVEKVQIANNGKIALQLLEQQSQSDAIPDLILLDINMPVMGGVEFMTAFQELELEQKESIKVVILTTSNHPRDLQCFADLPVAGFLNKPLTTQKITSLLEQHFPS
ncbi:response regulator [Pontibacter mangrovi]|uniref:Response regulator n=1 Tax=Pontibacter mangrovi TaxID=2589816 RepID=A0A501W4J4_9BACT|nr:response regulator [Pontibacter mangrovi]